jgi:hypothetical protein
MNTRRPCLFVAVAGLALFACGRAEQKPAAEAAAPPPVSAPAPTPFRVGALELGRTIGPDKRVSAPVSEFAPTDTIYASVATDGAAPSVALTARWSYEDGQLVNESTETIAPTGPAVTEFHIAKPDGLPAGRYKVEITANGAPAATREFEVR